MIKLVLFCSFFLGLSFAKPYHIIKEDTCGYAACPVTDPDRLNVHIVPHSHDDVGWLKNVDQYYYDDVQNVISSVIVALKQNPERKFIQVETAYFRKWWERQNNATKETVIELVNNGQFEITGGGWSMNDEAAVHYQSTIDQYTIGFRYLDDNLGYCSRPRLCWQIDPFGHSREQASIVARFGFDGFIFVRLDYRDKNYRKEKQTMDLIWKGSANLKNSEIFTSILYGHYSAPSGFCFDIQCSDEPIIDDEESLDYNYEQRVSDFAELVKKEAEHFPTNNILITMGDDFRYKNALNTYINLDLLIKGFKKFDQGINVFYSTPSCYTKAVNEYVNNNNYELEIKTDDFFPYADGPNSVWAGYFTSRPASKRFERLGNNLLQVTKQLASFGQLSYKDEKICSLRDAMGVMQHHDAITGTEKQAVTESYHTFLHIGFENAISVCDSILSAWITSEEQDETLEFKSCLLANVSYCPQSKSDKFTIAVYNPLSRPVSTFINLPVDSENFKIIDPDGNEVVYQIDPLIRDFSYIPDLELSSNNLIFEAQNIPQLGYKVYQIEKLNERKKSKEIKKLTSIVGTDNTQIELDDETGLLKSVTMNGVSVDIKQQFMYYLSHPTSGAYIFDPLEESLRPISNKVENTLISGDVYDGVLQKFSDWAYQIIKVYKNEDSYIEFDWVIGPLDFSDEDKGKEVVSKYTSSLRTDGVFYTDSNGREMIERKRNFRPTFEYEDSEPEAGNYYPVNNKIVLKDNDRDVELAIITDRSEGGSSLNDGEIELMIHRNCQSDDGRGVGENLNEQQYDQGIVVRGQHYLVLGPVLNGEKTLAAIERDITQRKVLAPWTFITDKDVASKLKNLTGSGIKESIVDSVQILTLEPWKENTLLIRLEHVLEETERVDEEDITIDLSDLSDKFTINELQETTLDGNRKLEDISRLEWPISAKSKTNSTIYKLRDVDDFKITLSPMEIKTFWATITYN